VLVLRRGVWVPTSQTRGRGLAPPDLEALMGCVSGAMGAVGFALAQSCGCRCERASAIGAWDAEGRPVARRAGTGAAAIRIALRTGPEGREPPLGDRLVGSYTARRWTRSRSRAAFPHRRLADEEARECARTAIERGAPSALLTAIRGYRRCASGSASATTGRSRPRRGSRMGL